MRRVRGDHGGGLRRPGGSGRPRKFWAGPGGAWGLLGGGLRGLGGLGGSLAALGPLCSDPPHRVPFLQQGVPRMAVPDARPNHTIYINNLNEKIKKDGGWGEKGRFWGKTRAWGEMRGIGGRNGGVLSGICGILGGVCRVLRGYV